MRQALAWVTVCCLAGLVAYGSQSSGREVKFSRLGASSGVTKSGASWQGSLYETETHARVFLTIVYSGSHQGAKNEYDDWLKRKEVRVISKGEIQGKRSDTDNRAVVKAFVPSECDEGIAILVTAGKTLRIIQSCSAKAAFEFEKQANQSEKMVN